MLTAKLFASFVVFIVMANGVHGGLRDLANDARCGARSTAIAMGARIDGEGRTLPVVVVFVNVDVGFKLLLLIGYGLPLLTLGWLPEALRWAWRPAGGRRRPESARLSRPTGR